MTLFLPADLGRGRVTGVGFSGRTRVPVLHRGGSWLHGIPLQAPRRAPSPRRESGLTFFCRDASPRLRRAGAVPTSDGAGTAPCASCNVTDWEDSRTRVTSDEGLPRSAWRSQAQSRYISSRYIQRYARHGKNNNKNVLTICFRSSLCWVSLGLKMIHENRHSKRRAA